MKLRVVSIVLSGAGWGAVIAGHRWLGLVVGMVGTLAFGAWNYREGKEMGRLLLTDSQRAALRALEARSDRQLAELIDLELAQQTLVRNMTHLEDTLVAALVAEQATTTNLRVELQMALMMIESLTNHPSTREDPPT